MPGVAGGGAGLGALDFLRNNPQVLFYHHPFKFVYVKCVKNSTCCVLRAASERCWVLPAML
jgi:hypothetical protein